MVTPGVWRLFVRWKPCPGRSGTPLFTRGKGGCRSASDFVSHLIAFDSIAPQTGEFGPCGRAEREPFGHTRRLEPQRRGAVTRRAVAQRRSRASGLTRPSAAAISDFRLDGLAELAAQRFSKRNAYSLPSLRSGLSNGP